MSSDLTALAKNAYIFGYPFVYDLNEVIKQTTDPNNMMAGPVNTFRHATKLAGPEDTFVSINNDTLYSIAHCDVTSEPLVLHVPDTQDRYYVMQFVDAWTNNFAYVGRRATGTAEGSYLLAGPAWQADAPAGMPVICSLTNVFTIVGRIAVSGAADVPAVEALQAELWLTPLSRYPKRPDSSERRKGDWQIAPWDERVPEELRFWEQLRAWMKRFPAPAGDQAFVQSLAPLGVLDATSPYVNADSAVAGLLQAGAQAGQAEIEAITRSGQAPPVNGWSSALHTFDYNLDNFQIGAIDAPEWKVADRSTSYIHRAGAARAGLWGNHGYEAFYAWVYVDDANEQMNGTRKFRLHFATLPPAEAFWSVTMYDMPSYYLAANPLERYSIGDRTPGIRYNADGSLDIYIQHDSPGTGTEANWLPAPEGDFRPLIRMYQPGASVLAGDYELPPVRRVE